MKRAWTLILAAAMVISLISAGVVRGETRPAAKDIPVQSLIVGTFLIHLSALDKEVVDLAEKSAENSGQKKKFYKSELAKGVWLDISGSGNVEGLLTSKGVVVTNAEIDALVLTHWAKEPGKIIDLATGQAVTARQIEEPVNTLPEGLKFLQKELEDTTNEIQILRKKQEKDVDDDADDKLDIMNPVLLPMNWEQSYQTYLNFEDALSRIQQYKNHIHQTQKEQREAFIAEVLELEKSVAAEEKIYVTEVVSQRLKAAIDKANEEAYSDQSKALSASSSMVVDARNNLINSRGGQSADALGTEKNVLQKAILDQIFAVKFQEADAVMEEMLSINNIKANLIRNKEIELRVLNRILEKTGKSLKKQSDIKNFEKYTKAKAAGEAKVVLDKLAEENAGLVKVLAKDMEYLKTEILKRTDTVQGKAALLEEVMALVSDIVTQLSQGNEADIASNLPAAQANGEFLNTLRSELKDLKLASDNAALSGANAAAELLDQLKEQKDQFMAAADAGQQGTANDLKGKIGELLGKIVQNLSSTGASDKTGQNSGGAGAADAALSTLKQDYLAALQAGDGTTLADLEKKLGAAVDKLGGSAGGKAAGELLDQLKEQKDQFLAAVKAGQQGTADALKGKTGELLDKILQELNGGAGAAKNALGNLQQDYLAALLAGDEKKLTELENLIGANIDQLAGNIAGKTAAELTAKKSKLEEQILEVQEAYLRAVEKGDLTAAAGLKEQLNALLKQLADNGTSVLTELNKANAEKKQLEEQLDQAILSGDSFAANALSEQIALADLTITGLLGQLEDKDKNLLADFRKRAEAILGEIEQGGDANVVSKVEAGVKGLLDTYQAFDDPLQSFANDDGIVDKISEALRRLLATLSGNGDSASAAVLLKSLNLLSDAAAEMDADLDEREDAGILALLIQKSPGDPIMEKQVSDHYARQNDINAEKEAQAIYRNSFLGVNRDNKPAVRTLAGRFSAGAERLLIAGKGDIIAKILLAKRGMEKKLDIDAEKLRLFTERNVKQLLVLESSLYTPEELQQVVERGKGIEDSYGYAVLGQGAALAADRNLRFLNPALLREDTVYLPVRDLFAGLGGSVVWVGTEYKAAVNYKGMEIKIYPENGEVVIGGQEISVPEGILVLDGYVYIPARLAADLTGYRAVYDREYKLLILRP